MFGDHLLAHSLFLLGALEEDRVLMREAEKCFQSFVVAENKIPLTDYAKSDYCMMVGRCRALMEEQETAIGAYNESLGICVLPLTQIYKSEALVNIGQPDSARELLTKIDKASAPVENLHDYAIAWTLLAATTQK
jgi:tetratricopeptide (TPR) repeat protein